MARAAFTALIIISGSLDVESAALEEVVGELMLLLLPVGVAAVADARKGDDRSSCSLHDI
ncbi:hypothetical protein D3C80_1864430 [compost metagenome]